MGTANRRKTTAKTKQSPLIERIVRTATSTKKKTKKTKATLLRKIPLRNLIAIYLILIFATASGAAVFAHAYTGKADLPDSFSPGQHAAVGFSLYYPASLPEGYYVDLSSVAGVQTSVITLRLTNGKGDSSPEGRAMTISQQAAPKHFAFQTFLESFGNKTTVKTKHGLATIGTIDDGRTRIASLVTDDGTWLLINASSKVDTSDVQYVLAHLSKTK